MDSNIQKWLEENEFDDELGTCQLRRTLSSNGKSKCYINGIPTTVSNTKQLGEMLVDIHGQHAHQSLMTPEKQLELLDRFANNNTLLTEVKSAYRTWQQLLAQQQQLRSNDSNFNSQRDLLQYQLDELESLQLVDGEFEELSNEHKQLSSIQSILSYINDLEQGIDGEYSVSNNINSIISTANKLASIDDKAQEISELFNQALIYIDEAQSALSRYSNSLEINPERLYEVEQRMGQIHDIARKHHIAPDNLLEFQQKLCNELTELDEKYALLGDIDKKIIEAETQYQICAEKLSKARQKAAKKLCAEVDSRLSMLNLENARFTIQFNDKQTNTQTNNKPIAKRNGIDTITFYFAPNPGQGEKPLHKIASGGELSRISLAIQVASVTSHKETTLIFDEVDSGIGGATAEVVGRLLKTLAQYNQVICVTHLAQVAAFADQHIKIHKTVENGKTFTQFECLDEQSRLEELARMSGGINPDKKTQDHAKNLRNNAIQFTQTLK